MEEITTKKIVKSRILNCTLKEAWWKWTTHEGLLTFFGHDNKIELKLGGAFEIYFLTDNPVGLKGAESCQIISFLPEQMLSFTWNAPPEYPEIRNHRHKTWVVVFFKSKNNKTTIEINHIGWLQGVKWDAVYNYFNIAWDKVLDWMEKSCE